MIIGFCLGIMLILSLLSIVMGNSWSGTSFETIIDNTAIVNGSSATWEIPTLEGSFTIDPLMGALVILTITLSIIAVAGVNIFGTGLNTESVRMISIGIIYAGVWFMLSFLSYPLITSIETFGQMIYWSLTIVYVIGVVQRNWGGSD